MYVSMGKHGTKCKAILSNDFCSALLYSTVFDGGGSGGQRNRSWWHIYLATIVFCVSKYVRVNVAAILPFGTQTKHIEPKESRNHFYSKNNEQKFFSSLLLLMCACVFVCMDWNRKSQKFSMLPTAITLNSVITIRQTKWYNNLSTDL